MVRPAGTPPPPGGLDLPDPTWRYLARRGVPVFAVEGVIPILLFYAAWKLWGLTAGILVSSGLTAAVLLRQIRRGQAGAVARVTLVFLAVQAAVGLASQSETVYLAQPVVFSACWGCAYLVSAAVGRPLIGLFAQAWYPFPPEFRASKPYRREFGMQSVVWGVFCLARASVRLAALLGSGVGGFVLVTFLTGMPFFFGLVFWGLWHARRTFSRLDLEPEPAPAV